jgi:1-acyl-sn-glycerol-3-phosphate acyltransferase
LNRSRAAVNRGDGHRAVNQVIEQGQARLNDGLWIIIFPEGTRVVAGETRKFGVSGALLAIASGKDPRELNEEVRRSIDAGLARIAAAAD